jgi:hypothetical protein
LLPLLLYLHLLFWLSFRTLSEAEAEESALWGGYTPSGTTIW